MPRNMANKKIDRAMASLIIEQPFFAHLLLRMRKVESTSFPTMATDGESIFYNPQFVENITHNEVMGVLAHEAMHPALLHHIRKGARDHFRWNVAGDYAINPLLVDAGLKLPKGGLLDDKYRDMSSEEIYAKLPECTPPDPQGPGGEGEGDGGADGDSDGDGKIAQCEWGEVLDKKNGDGSSLSPDQLRKEEAEQKIGLQQAANTAKKQGKLPAGMQRMIDELLAPKLDWRTILSRWAGELARCDYSWRFPNTRYAGTGFALPSLRSESLGKVLFAMDTSGSMSDDDLRDILGEVCGAMAEYEADGTDPSVTVLWCDTEVHEQEISDPSEFDPKGYGGTRYKPVFDYIKDNGLDPKAVVYLTDGYCNDFDYDPGCPVLWGLTEKCPTFEPSFGEVMVINK